MFSITVETPKTTEQAKNNISSSFIDMMVRDF